MKNWQIWKFSKRKVLRLRSHTLVQKKGGGGLAVPRVAFYQTFWDQIWWKLWRRHTLMLEWGKGWRWTGGDLGGLGSGDPRGAQRTESSHGQQHSPLTISLSQQIVTCSCYEAELALLALTATNGSQVVCALSWTPGQICWPLTNIFLPLTNICLPLTKCIRPRYNFF